MRHRVITYTICILLLTVLQTTLVDYISINGIKPNLLLVFVVSAAILRGNVEGAAIGFSTGLILDMLFGRVLGFFALLGFYLGIVIGSVNKRVYRENYLVAIVLTFVSSVIYEGLVYLLNAFMKGNVELLVPLVKAILIEAAYNSGIAIIIFALVIRLNRKFEELGKAERKY